MNAVRFGLIGLGTGGLYAIIGIGLVLVYRASGVLNFAGGAIAAICAFVFYDIHTTHHITSYVACPVTIAFGAAIGVAVHWGAMSRLREASALVRLIATLGILALIEGIALIIWGPNIQLVTSILPTRPIHFASTLTLSEDRMILVIGTVVLAVALKLIYSNTTFGLATSAVAENRRSAASSGWSTSTIELINWAIGGALSAVAGMFIAPIVGLQVLPLTLLVVPALAAALVGRFNSFMLTLLGAMLIGVIQSECALYVTTTGVADSVPFLIIIGVLVAGGSARPTRGDLPLKLPAPGDGKTSPVLLLLGTVIGLVLTWTLNGEFVTGLLTTFIFGIVILSVVVVSGYGGQLSLGQWALAGIGAWFSSRLVYSLHFPFWAAALAGIVLAAISGLVVALPAMRTRGVNLCMATLGLAEVITSVVLSNGALTGGYGGLRVGSASLFGINLSAQAHPRRYATLALIAFAVTGMLVANVRRGRSGRRMLAVRSDERAAAALGVGVYGVKLYAFGLAAGIAAVAGILAAFQNPIVVFSQFDVFTNIYIVMYAVIGGIGWASGTPMGATMASGSFIAVLFNVFFGSNVNSYLAPVAGGFVVFNLIIAPQGLAELNKRTYGPLLRRLNDLLTRLAGLVVPERQRGPAVPVGRTHDAPEPRPQRILELRELSVRYGGVQALTAVSLRVESGEVLGLIGPNGAGKTTLLDAVTGFTKPSGGAVLLDGVPILGRSPVRISRSGISRSFQAVQLFDAMTIRENLLTALDDKRLSAYLADLVRPKRAFDEERFWEVVNEFSLEPVLDKKPSELSHGTARLVGVARAVLCQPSVLFLDEPAAGLGTDERMALGPMIRRLASRWGIAVVLVEHDVALVLETCDRIVVLDFGRQIAAGSPAAIRDDPAVITAYLGEGLGTGAAAGSSALAASDRH